MDLNAMLLAGAATIASFGIGWVALNVIRTGFDYTSSRGNPRNRGQAHEALWDHGKGALLIAAGTIIAGLMFATFHG
jgi:hypothetical protein